MATNQDDFTAIATRFYSIFDNAHPGLKIVMDNDADTTEAKTVWCRLSIIPNDIKPLGVGKSATYRQFGRVYLQVFLPERTGILTGTAIQQSFTTAFRDWNADAGRIKTFELTFGSDDHDPDYLMMMCTARYFAFH